MTSVSFISPSPLHSSVTTAAPASPQQLCLDSRYLKTASQCGLFLDPFHLVCGEEYLTQKSEGELVGEDEGQGLFSQQRSQMFSEETSNLWDDIPRYHRLD